MDEIRDKFQHVYEVWAQVQSNVHANLDAHFNRHMPDVEFGDFEHLVEVLKEWLDRTRAAPGTGMAMRLVEPTIIASLNFALTTLQDLARGQYNQANWRNLLYSLSNSLNALVLALRFGDQKTITEDVAAAYADAISKKAEAEDVTKLASEITDFHNLLQEKNENASSLVEEIDEYHDQLSEITTQCAELQSKTETNAQAVAEADQQVEEKIGELDQAIQSSDQLHEEQQQMQKDLVENKGRVEKLEEMLRTLLPEATAAGLSTALALRAKRLGRIKWGWALAFLIGVSALFGISFYIFVLSKQAVALTGTEYLLYSLKRLPASIPIIWFSWFSSVQYGNTVRLEEDYTFKAATCNTFAGFRDHIENFQEAETRDSVEELLSRNTLTVLAKDPLRIFGKVRLDAAPPGFSTYENAKNSLTKD